MHSHCNTTTMTPQPRIIAICGTKGAGKDTLAEHVSRVYGFQHIAVANKLKDVCKTLFDFNDEQLHGSLKEVVDSRYGVSPRQCLQFIGTEVMQYKIQELMPNMGRNFWIKSTISALDMNTQYVVSDVRFPHELDAFENLRGGCLSIRVDRQSCQLGDIHASELGHREMQVDYVISNNGTPDAMFRMFDEWYATCADLNE